MLVLPSPQQAETLRDAFAAAGYTEESLLARYGTAHAVSLSADRLTAFRYSTRRGEGVDVLAQLLMLGQPVAKQATAALPEDLLQLALRLAIFRDDGDSYHPSCLLVPHGPVLIASDLYDKHDEDDAFEHVLSTGPAARQLANFVVPNPGAHILDLCGGGGVQGLLAASWAERVCITDISKRAIEYARFNAALNGIDNCEFRSGPDFEPVEGERFDQIICNPPFIVTPSHKLVALGNEVELDGFCRELTRHAPRYLCDGGLYQMIFECTELEGEPWQERLTSWCTGLGCDAWILKVYSQPPERYATTRIPEARRVAGDAIGSFADWMGYYDEHKVRTIHGGLMVLRRRTGRTWLHIEELERAPTGAFGEVVREGLARLDFLAGHESDEALLDAHLALDPRAYLETAQVQSDGGWGIVRATLCCTEGLPREQALAPPIAQFLALFDGRTDVRHQIAQLAQRTQADPREVRSEALRIIRLMLKRGFLLPAVDGAGAAAPLEYE